MQYFCLCHSEFIFPAGLMTSQQHSTVSITPQNMMSQQVQLPTVTLAQPMVSMATFQTQQIQQLSQTSAQNQTFAQLQVIGPHLVQMMLKKKRSPWIL